MNFGVNSEPVRECPKSAIDFSECAYIEQRPKLVNAQRIDLCGYLVCKEASKESELKAAVEECLRLSTLQLSERSATGNELTSNKMVKCISAPEGNDESQTVVNKTETTTIEANKMHRFTRATEKQEAKVENEAREEPKAKKSRLADRISTVAKLDNGTMVEAFKYLNYCQLAKNSLVSMRFRNVIQTHRHKLAVLYVDSIRMKSIPKMNTTLPSFQQSRQSSPTIPPNKTAGASRKRISSNVAKVSESPVKAKYEKSLIFPTGIARETTKTSRSAIVSANATLPITLSEMAPIKERIEHCESLFFNSQEPITDSDDTSNSGISFIDVSNVKFIEKEAFICSDDEDY
ncbi:hypothetical protein DdX_19699 [Ditylenchus destructor]|uniref:Uncharacterized protein n=1 Tax=Ditylenchus destructor TaxID=166010 RepID=A0AAD4QS72_9BILA|nr:hypothetical protein DdX_19699 [Ditylenchus destructor]